MDTSNERTLKAGLAHHLRNHATALLSMAQRLDGDAPALHNNAEFQALEIMLKDLHSLHLKFRKAFAPYNVAQ
jgi:hypothetical protein